jgi:MFS family permease
MNAVGFYLLMTSIAVFAEDTFDTTHSVAGFAVSAFLIGSLFCRIFLGRYMDTAGRKRILIISSIFNTVVCFAYLLAESVALLIAIRILHGLSFAVISTVFLTAGMATLPKTRKGEGNAYFSLGIAAGTAIGPFLAVYITSHFSYDMLFYVCSITSFISVILILPAHVTELTPDMRIASIEKRKSEKFTVWSVLEKSAVPVAVIMFFGAIGYGSVLSFMNAYAIEEKMTGFASVFFLVYAGVLFISKPPAGRLFDRYGENLTAPPAFACFAVAMFIMSAAGYTGLGFLLLVAAVFTSVGYGTIMSVFQTVVVRDASPARMGMAISTFYVAMDMGNGVGGYLIGGLIDIVGFRLMYITVGVVLALLIPAYWFLHGKKHRRNY